MRLKLFSGIAACLLLAVLWQPAFGRILEDWDYDRLFKESDLVVIAKAVETEDSKDKLVKGWPLEFVGMDTKFEVHHTLKGKSDKNVKVLHYKFGDPIKKDEKGPFAIVDGPMFVKFRSETYKSEDGKVTVPQPEYMLFLKKREDGRFEPMSGAVDPQLSVREVFKPLCPDLGGSKAD